MTDQVDPGATGTIVNTATVTAANDANPGNNSASDTDTIGIPSWTLSTIVTYGGAGDPGRLTTSPTRTVGRSAA